MLLYCQGSLLSIGLALSQLSIHEPLGQTGYSAQQGRFDHRQNQAFRPPFGQSASFPTLPVTVRRPRFVPERCNLAVRPFKDSQLDSVATRAKSTLVATLSTAFFLFCCSCFSSAPKKSRYTSISARAFAACRKAAIASTSGCMPLKYSMIRSGMWCISHRRQLGQAALRNPFQVIRYL